MPTFGSNAFCPLLVLKVPLPLDRASLGCMCSQWWPPFASAPTRWWLFAFCAGALYVVVPCAYKCACVGSKVTSPCRHRRQQRAVGTCTGGRTPASWHQIWRTVEDSNRIGESSMKTPRASEVVDGRFQKRAEVGANPFNNLLYFVLDDSTTPFWPALHCFMMILDRLGSKVWGQLIDPIQAFQTIIESPSYNNEIESIRKSCYRSDSKLSPWYRSLHCIAE